MNCSLGGVIALILATIALIVGAIAAAVTSTFVPYPYDSGLLIVATGLVAGALFGMLSLIESAIRAYQSCRDAAEGSSDCPTNNVGNYFLGIRSVLGIALSTFGIAVLKIVVPWIGKYLAGKEIIVGVAACGIAIALLLALLAELLAYKSCRDNEPKPVPPSRQGSGLSFTGPGVVTINVEGSTTIAITTQKGATISSQGIREQE